MVEELDLASYEEIADAVDAKRLSGHWIACAEMLLEACSDWPSAEVRNPSDLLRKLENEVPGSLTYEELAKVASDPKRDIWVMASVESVLNIFRRENEIDQHSKLADLMLELTSIVRSANAGSLPTAGPNQSLEPTRVGEPPLAAQLQR